MIDRRTTPAGRARIIEGNVRDKWILMGIEGGRGREGASALFWDEIEVGRSLSGEDGSFIGAEILTESGPDAAFASDGHGEDTGPFIIVIIMIHDVIAIAVGLIGGAHVLLPELSITWILERHGGGIWVVCREGGDQWIAELGLRRKKRRRIVEREEIGGLVYVVMIVRVGGVVGPRDADPVGIEGIGGGEVGEGRDGSRGCGMKVEDIGGCRWGDTSWRRIGLAGLMAGADGGGLAVKFDVGAATLALDTFGLSRSATAKETERRAGVPQGLAPSHGREDWTHWSHACLEVVAREAEDEPFRREPGLTSGFSSAWHLLM